LRDRVQRLCVGSLSGEDGFYAGHLSLADDTSDAGGGKGTKKGPVDMGVVEEEELISRT